MNTIPAVSADCRPTPLEQAATSHARAQPAATPRTPAERAAADPFALSGTAAAARDLAAAPPVDAARVASLKAAIADGRYTVDPLAIADRMMALDLPGA